MHTYKSSFSLFIGKTYSLNKYIFKEMNNLIFWVTPYTDDQGKIWSDIIVKRTPKGGQKSFNFIF